jgi:hypothetical protein
VCSRVEVLRFSLSSLELGCRGSEDSWRIYIQVCSEDQKGDKEMDKCLITSIPHLLSNCVNAHTMIANFLHA